MKKTAAQQERTEHQRFTLFAGSVGGAVGDYSLRALWTTGGPVFELLGFLWLWGTALLAGGVLMAAVSHPLNDRTKKAWARSAQWQFAAKVWAISGATLVGVCVVAAWFISHPLG